MSWEFEHCIAPGQSLVFTTPLDADLEVYVISTVHAIERQTIACRSIRVEQHLIDHLLQWIHS